MAHLLAAPYAIDQVIANGFSDPNDEETVEKLASIIFESDEGKYVRYTEMGTVEKAKHVGLYVDHELALLGLAPEDFDRDDMDKLAARARFALDLIFDEMALRIARSTYLASH